MITFAAPYEVKNPEVSYGFAQSCDILKTEEKEGKFFTSVGFYDADGKIFASRHLEFKATPSDSNILTALGIDVPKMKKAAGPAPTAA